MPWDVEYLADEKIISIVNEGSVTYKDYEEQTIKALELEKKHNMHLFLSDNSKATNTATVFEIFHLPSLYDRLGAQRINKLAIILPKPPYNNEEYEFYETICINRGWNVKLFQDRQSAIEWLTTK